MQATEALQVLAKKATQVRKTQSLLANTVAMITAANQSRHTRFSCGTHCHSRTGTRRRHGSEVVGGEAGLDKENRGTARQDDLNWQKLISTIQMALAALVGYQQADGHTMSNGRAAVRRQVLGLQAAAQQAMDFEKHPLHDQSLN